MFKFKSFITCFLVLSQITFFFAQTKADSISKNFPKILIINDKHEVLLGFDNDRKAYEVPSIGFIKGPISFKTYIDKATQEIGITYKSFRLGGLFTYIFPDEFGTFIRPYFVVQFKDYSNGKSLADPDCKWFSLDSAVQKIPYPASARIVKQIISKPKTVWGATFEEYGYTNPVDISKIKFKILETFYKLN
jgi:hypothetical protein